MEVTAGGTVFHLTPDELAQSEFLVTLEGRGDVPLLNVSQESMVAVCTFLAYHATEPFPTIPKPIPSSEMRDLVGDWDARFVASLSSDQLADVAMAAHYLHIPTLMNLSACKIASLLFRKSRAEMRRALKF